MGACGREEFISASFDSKGIVSLILLFGLEELSSSSQSASVPEICERYFWVPELTFFVARLWRISSSEILLIFNCCKTNSL